MSSIRRLVIPIVLAAALAPAVSFAQPPAARRVLFIGNSYTYFNNLPALVAALAGAAGVGPVEVRMVASGGWRLADHWERGDARAALASGRWDFVVLQEQSQLGDGTVVNGRPRITTDAVFAPAAANWTKAIGLTGARPVLYMTWAKEAVPEDQPALTEAYQKAARLGGALVAPVGIAWSRVRQEHPEIRLFDSDGSHPSQAGSYLAACTLLATLFQKNPAGLPGELSGSPVDLESARVDAGRRAVLVSVPAAQARVLQSAAWAAAQAAPRPAK